MPEYAHLLVDDCPSVSSLRRHRDPLLVALVREHGQPRYDYPPKLVQYYDWMGASMSKPRKHEP